MSGSKFKAFWDFVSLSGGETISKIAGFVAFAYLARVLNPASYGAVEVAAALLSFFSLVVDFGYGPIGARQIAQHPTEAARYATSISSARLLLALGSVPVMCLVAVLMGQPDQTVTLIWIYAFALLASPWNQRWLLQGLDKMGVVSLGQLIRMTLFAVGVAVFVHNPDDLAKVGFVEVASAVAMAGFFIATQRHVGVPVRVSMNLRELVDISKQSLATGLSQAAWAFYQYLPIILIATVVGGVQTAWFAAAHRIVFSVVGFSLIYHFNLYPVVARRLKHSRDSFQQIVKPSFRIAAWGSIFIALVLSLYAESLCGFVFGEEFRTAGLPLAILIWTLPITLLSGHSRWALIAAHKQRYVFYSQATGLLATLAAGVLLIPEYGALGGSVTMVISAAAVWITAHGFASRHIGKIPSIFDIVRPVAFSMTIIYLAYTVTGLSWYGNLAYLLGFAAMGLVTDRSIVRDIQTMLRIKSEDAGETAIIQTDS